MTGYNLEIIDGRNLRENNRRALIYRHPPFFTVFISIFQLFSFVYYALRAYEPLTFDGPIPFKSKLIYDPTRRYEIWRYLTYMFIHAGYWHITFNLLIQIAVGIPLEIVHKFNPVFIIYIGGVFGGALATSVVEPHKYLAGASTGCYALIAAHLANMIINWKELKAPYMKLITLLAFSALDFGIGIYQSHFKYEYVSRVTYSGHLSGFFCGLLLGSVFLRNVEVHDWERTVKHVTATIYLTLAVVAIVYNMFSDSYPLPDDSELIWSQNPFMRDRG